MGEFMIRMQVIIRCVLVIWSGGVAMTQDVASKTVTFRSLAFQPGIKAELYVNNGNEFERFQFSHLRPSGFSTGRLDAEGDLVLFEKHQNSEGVEEFLVNRRVTIPQGGDHVLLLIVQSEERLGIFSIEDNLSENDKDWLFLNITPSRLVIKLGEGTKPFPLEPGEVLPYQIPFESGEGIPVQILAWENEKWKRVYSTYWPVYDGQRSMVVCIPDGEKIRVKNYFERTLLPEREPAP
jgi:hypothetical protein